MVTAMERLNRCGPGAVIYGKGVALTGSSSFSEFPDKGEGLPGIGPVGGGVMGEAITMQALAKAYESR